MSWQLLMFCKTATKATNLIDAALAAEGNQPLREM
jgi:SAM-dependent methyltransferase